MLDQIELMCETLISIKKIIDFREERITEKDLQGSSWKFFGVLEFDIHYSRHSRDIKTQTQQRTTHKKNKTFRSYELRKLPQELTALLILTLEKIVKKYSLNIHCALKTYTLPIQSKSYMRYLP